MLESGCSSETVTMSTVKSPAEKKRLSLKRDRRNRYGENSKASRKGIRAGKQRSHMKERRDVSEILATLGGSVTETDASEADALAKVHTIQNRRKAFKKRPDTPLGEVLARKLSKKS
jgi:hypothetical protein